MVAAAPRIDPRLRRVARRLGCRLPVAADVHRAVGEYAERLQLPRPSYQQVRLLVNDARRKQAARKATVALLVDIELGRRPITDLRHLLKV